MCLRYINRGVGIDPKRRTRFRNLWILIGISWFLNWFQDFRQEISGFNTNTITANQNATTGYSLQKERKYGPHGLNSMRRRAKREAEEYKLLVAVTLAKVNKRLARPHCAHAQCVWLPYTWQHKRNYTKIYGDPWRILGFPISRFRDFMWDFERFPAQRTRFQPRF